MEFEATLELKPLNGQFYIEFLKKMHSALTPEWYLEIGTQKGLSLEFSQARSIAVDPEFRLKTEVLKNKPELHLFQETSDEFFAKGRLDTIGAKMDLVFLDGMHLFEYLLRDFIGSEKHCTHDSHVIMHDCLPFNTAMASRNRTDHTGPEWAGDVWKLIPILKEYRPDLVIEIYDCAPTGLVVIKNLDPKSTILSESYDAIIDRYMDETLDNYGVIRYLRQLNTQRAASAQFQVTPPILKLDINKPLDISIKIPARNRAAMKDWGDYHFAKSIAKSLNKLGHRTTIDPKSDWYAHQNEKGFDLVIKGGSKFRASPNRLCLTWLISKGARWWDLDQSAHIFVASELLLSKLRANNPDNQFSLLLQGFDADLMQPLPNISPNGVVFVGRHRTTYDRSSVEYAIETGVDIQIWGPGWEGTPAAHMVRGTHVDNDHLSEIYASSCAVLNDHTPVMKNAGFPSNRIFDALACGVPVITDSIAWMPKEFAPFVYVYETPEMYKAAVQAAINESPKRRAERIAFAKKMKTKHTFDVRAKQIISTLKSLKKEAST